MPPFFYQKYDWYYFSVLELLETLKPELIAPVVAWLCHEECCDNGSIIESAGGWAGKCKYKIFFIFWNSKQY